MELESEVSAPETMAEILVSLGLVPQFRYEKFREVWRVGQTVICLDETPIGRFVEIEGTAAAIHRIAAALGLSPDRFLSTLESRGMDVAGRLTFRDHHWFTAADVARATDAARACGADIIVTTEKDAVRLPPGTRWAVLPMTVTIEPAEAFATWLLARL